MHTQNGAALTVSDAESNLTLNVSRATLELGFVLPSEHTDYPTLKDQYCNALIGHIVSMAYAQAWAPDHMPQPHRLKTAFLHSGLGEAQSLSPYWGSSIES